MNTKYPIIKKKRSVLITICTLITVLLFAAPVFADGEEVPAEATQQPEVPPEEMVVEEEPAPVEEITDESPDGEVPDEAVDEPVFPEPLEGEPEQAIGQAEDERVADSAAASGLEFTDCDGEALDLASEATAEALAGADPYFYVGTKKYQFLPDGMTCPAGTEGDTCWVSDPGANPIQDAIAYINSTSTLPSDRKIYVESGDYTGDVSVDTSTEVFSSMLNGIIGAGSSTTTITGNVLINQNLSGFTLSGFTINGSLTVMDSTGTLVLTDLDVTSPDGDGIHVSDQDGNVEISNTRSSGNHGNGAVVEYGTTTGNVQVSNSSFDDNGNTINDDYEVGLKIITVGSITIEGVSASRNAGGGINLHQFSELTIANTVANYNAEPYYVHEYGIGINALSDQVADVELENIQANYNANHGIYISTNGSVKAKNIEAQYNTIRTGTIENLYKVNDYLTDDVVYDEWRFEGSSGQDVLITLETLSTLHQFDPVLHLYDSAYTLLASDDNSMDGEWNALIDTTLSADGIYYLRIYRASGTDSGLYSLKLNYDDGIDHVYEYGATGMSFSTWDGTGTFSLQNGFYNGNAGEGLYIYNRNSVSISVITSTNNGSDGIYINKSGSDWECPPGGGACTLLGYTGEGKVTINSPSSTGWLTANDLSGNSGAGLYVYATGNIVVSNTDAVSNSIGGMTLNNCLGDYYTGICNGTGSVTVNVTIPNWYNYIGENSGNGIQVSSTGTVKLEQFSANYNGVKGVEVETMGNISIKDAEVFHNYDTGAYLSTLIALRTRTITVIDSDFNENEGTGLVVHANGPITLKGVNADDNYSPVSATMDYVPITVYDQIIEGDVREVYYFYGTSGEWLDIILRSNDFDAYVELRNNIGEPIDSNDNSGGGTDARIIHALLYTGWFQIHVSYIGENQTGDYTLSVNDYYNLAPIYPASGVELDNSSGSGNVTITTTKSNPENSFSNNDNFGIKISTNGAVSVKGAGGNYNYRSGIDVNAIGSVSVQDRSKTPSLSFSYNRLYGIKVQTLGAIKLYGISASGNVLNGADLENCFYSGEMLACTGNGKVTIATRTNYLADFSNNGGYGIRVDGNNSISLININAAFNGLSGVYLRNDYTSGAISIRNTSKTISSAFDNNGLYGIFARSLRTISLLNLSASNNVLSGAYLDSCREDEGECMGTGSISINSPKGMISQFDNNGEHGLLAYAYGSFKLLNVSANGNGLSGAYLDNNFGWSKGGVTIKKNGIESNQFNSNGTAGVYAGSAPAYRVGLYIDTRGAISLKNVEASYNSDGGMDSIWYGTPYAGSGLLAANNYEQSTGSASVYDSVFTNNDGYGLRIFSNGAISLKNINASDNGNIGAFVKNDYAEITRGISLLVSRGGWNTFNDNNGAGLFIETNGNVSLKDIDAKGNQMLTNVFADGGIGTASVREFYNDALGEDVWAFYALAGVPLTIQLDSVWSPYDAVFDPYLSLFDSGAVLLAADDNSGGGLNAELGYTPSSDGWYYVHVSGMFGVDGGYLLGINDPTFADVTELYAHGVYVNAGRNVSLTSSSINTFSNNSQDGLYVDAVGRISLQRLSANYNGTNGATLLNLSEINNVSVTGRRSTVYSDFYGNGQNGLVIHTNGKTLVRHVWAEGNTVNGVSLGSMANPVDQNITIYNVLAIANGNDGIKAYGSAKLYATQLHALDNGGNGAYLDNSSGLAVMTITGDSFFNGNGVDGIHAVTDYAVTISKITAEHNGGDGVQASANTGNITISNTYVKYSGKNGFNLAGNANISLTNVTGFSNGEDADGDGLNITASLTTVITLKYAAFVANEGNGIEISGGLVFPTLINTFYFGNDTDNDGDLNLNWH